VGANLAAVAVEIGTRGGGPALRPRPERRSHRWWPTPALLRCVDHGVPRLGLQRGAWRNGAAPLRCGRAPRRMTRWRPSHGRGAQHGWHGVPGRGVHVARRAPE